MTRAFALALIGTGLFSSPCYQASPELDVALVIAIDGSSSISGAEYLLQRDGFAKAFRSERVHRAVQQGALGKIVVTYVEWSDANQQRVLVPWTFIAGAHDAVAFADRIAEASGTGGRYTSISGAIAFSVGLLNQVPGRAMRRVIDISGDGPNNDGQPVTVARDVAVAEGITINGLPIQTKPVPWDVPGYDVNLYGLKQDWDVDHLDIYYTECVIGGPGAFIQSVISTADITEAIIMKILREIAAVPTPQSLVMKSRMANPVNCQGGELRRIEDENRSNGP